MIFGRVASVGEVGLALSAGRATMAAVTGPGAGGTRERRRWVLPAVAAGWAVLLTGGIVWSVRNDPPTVAEQRDVAKAVPELRTAFGALAAAAQDERWAIRLGATRVEDCAITPVRGGQELTRDVVLYVAEGDARTALEAVAQRLPEDYQAVTVATRGGTKLLFAADAGEFVGIEAAGQSTDQELSLRVYTGCRPSSGVPEIGDPVGGAEPAALATALQGLDAVGTPVTMTRAVSCPDGGTTATFTVDVGPADAEITPRGVPGGTELLWSGADGWAYRAGGDAVVVAAEGGRLLLNVTTNCRPA